MFLFSERTGFASVNGVNNTMAQGSRIIATPAERLARISNVSEAHFARSFKEAFGVPPHRYLLTRRIERAKALLRDSEMPITDIAFQTSWNSLGTFGRIFRDIAGESPGELRKREQIELHQRARLLFECGKSPRSDDRSFGEAKAGSGC